MNVLFGLNSECVAQINVQFANVQKMKYHLSGKSTFNQKMKGYLIMPYEALQKNVPVTQLMNGVTLMNMVQRRYMLT